ncbi:integrase [Streptomyces sp. M2CJ-2]|uniref:integrase n=1 Tax=Streptomyces sp. M2CJ-2 TaxID=2803948 RepID=UPI001F3CAE15|nr:integrase [Streptomyces sp. M2CJ-2]
MAGATAHPTAAWVAPAAKNLVRDLEDTGCRARFPIRDGMCPAPFEAVPADAGIEVVPTGARTPGMNSIVERRVRTCRRDLLDRILIWNQRHLLHALPEFGTFYHFHRPHQGTTNARPLSPLPAPIADTDELVRLDMRRSDRLGGILHASERAA